MSRSLYAKDPIEVLPIVLDDSELGALEQQPVSKKLNADGKKSKSGGQVGDETNLPRRKVVKLSEAMEAGIPLVTGSTFYHVYPSRARGQIQQSFKEVIDSFLLLHTQYLNDPSNGTHPVSSAKAKFIFNQLLVGNGCLSSTKTALLSQPAITGRSTSTATTEPFHLTGLGDVPPDARAQGSAWGSNYDETVYLLHALLQHNLVDSNDKSIETQLLRMIGRSCEIVKPAKSKPELICFETIVTKGAPVRTLLQFGGSMTSKHLFVPPPVQESSNNFLLTKLRTLVWKAAGLQYPTIEEVVQRRADIGLRVLVVGQAREGLVGGKSTYYIVENMRQVSQWLQTPQLQKLITSASTEEGSRWCPNMFRTMPPNTASQVVLDYVPRLPQGIAAQIEAISTVDLLVIAQGADMKR